MGNGIARIMLVERDEEMRLVVRLRLQLDGFLVVAEAATTGEAIAVLERARPHVVVTDLDLETLPRLREAAGDLAIVVYSWFADSLTLGAVLRAGADLYVDKAGGPARLSVHLSSLLAHPGFRRSPRPRNDERLRQVCAELQRLSAIARVRPLTPDEQHRARRLLLVEDRLHLVGPGRDR